MLKESGFQIAQELELDAHRDREPESPSWLARTSWVQSHGKQRAIEPVVQRRQDHAQPWRRPLKFPEPTKPFVDPGDIAVPRSLQEAGICVRGYYAPQSMRPPQEDRG